MQELIRRGTPRDLAAAQELMKSLAGANPDAKPDYRTQALTELNKLETKVILLNEAAAAGWAKMSTRRLSERRRRRESQEKKMEMC